MVKTGAVDRATMIADGCTNYWSFLNSYYFAGTVVTTLGYGNVYPATNPGKVLTCALSGLFLTLSGYHRAWLGLIEISLRRFQANFRFSAYVTR